MSTGLSIGGMQISFGIDLSGINSGMADMKASITGSVTDVVQQATSIFKGLDGAADGTRIISNVDVAEAQLTLLESKVTEARDKLQSLQDAADAGKTVTGIPEAEAQLTLLEAKAQEAAASLQELQQAESASSGFSGMISGMVGSLGDFGTSIGNGISSLLSFGSQLGQTMMGLQMFANMAQQTASALLQPAATAETTELSFTTLLHSTKAAHDEMQSLNSFAASTPMQTQWVDNAAAKILAFGGTTKDVIPEITAIGDSLSGLGKLSEPSLNSIVDIFGKMSAQGKLTGGDMMQLSTWGIPAWQALSDAMHKPIPELQKMVSAGLIPASQALPALEQGMEKTFGGGMAKQANTFTGLMSTLASNWQIAMAAIGDPTLKLAEQGLSSIGNILASQGFQNFATNVGKQIADTFRQIAGFVTGNVIPAFQNLMTYLNGDQFQGFVADVQTVGNQLSRMLAPTLQALGPIISQAFASIGPILTGVVLPAVDQFVFGLGQLLEFFNENKTAAQIVMDILIGIGVAFAAIQIGAFLATVPALIAGFIAWATTAGAAALATIAATWPLLAIGAAIALVVAGIILAVQHWGEITKFLQGVWTSFTTWFMGMLGHIGAFFTGIWNNISSFFSGMWNGLVGHAKSGGEALSSWWSGMWNGIVSVAKAIWAFIVDAVKIGALLVYDAIFGPFLLIGALFVWLYNHNTYVKELVDTIVKFFQDGIAWIQQAWTAAVSWLTGAWQNIVHVASSVWNAITEVIQIAVNVVHAYLIFIWVVISTWISSQWNGLVGIATSLWNAITGAIQTAVNAVWNWLVSIWTTISTWISTQWNKFAGFAQSAWQAVSAVFLSIWDTYISKPLSSLWTNITTWFTNLGNQARQSGINFINMLANAISSGAGSIWNAVVNIANTIWKALGFHSPAKEGPGSDADTWMPNLVSMLSSTLIAQQPKMTTAVATIAQPLELLNSQLNSYPVQSTSAIAAASIANRATVSPQQSTLTVILEVDGKDMGKITTPYVLDAAAKTFRAKVGGKV